MQYLLDVLKETVLFWCRHFLLLTVLTLIAVAPEKLSYWVMLESPHHFGLAGMVVFSVADIGLRSMQQTALLGLMLLPTGPGLALRAMRAGIATGWMKFVVLNAAVALFFGIFTGAFIVSVLKNPDVKSLKLMLAVTVLFTIVGYGKLGLALPVIIAEKLPLWSALARAWRLTSGDYFWVVLLSYFVMRLFSGGVGHFTQFHATSHQMPVIWQRIPLELVQAQVDCLYLVLLGVLYQKRTLHERFTAAFERL
jgi:hypothetical protein